VKSAKKRALAHERSKKDGSNLGKTEDEKAWSRTIARAKALQAAEDLENWNECYDQAEEAETARKQKQLSIKEQNNRRQNDIKDDHRQATSRDTQG
jgi:hypothetical protein